MSNYKLGFFGEEIDLKLQEIETLKDSIEQLEENNETITAAIERIDALIEDLGHASLGAVRHIQRGVTTPTAEEWTVALSGFTNADKMVAILNGECYHYSSVQTSAYVKSLSAASLTLGTMYYGSGDASRQKEFSYQVIEFY